MTNQTRGLRYHRTALKLSREKLARRVGECSASTIALIESGWRCSPEMAERIASAIDLKPTDLWETYTQ